MSKVTFGSALSKKDCVPQTYLNRDPHPNIPFLDDTNTIHYNWLAYLGQVVIAIIAAFLGYYFGEDISKWILSLI